MSSIVLYQFLLPIEKIYTLVILVIKYTPLRMKNPVDNEEWRKDDVDMRKSWVLKQIV